MSMMSALNSYHALSPEEREHMRRQAELRQLYEQQSMLWQIGFCASHLMAIPNVKINPALFDGTWDRAIEETQRKIAALEAEA